jgi:hypothetical protein
MYTKLKGRMRDHTFMRVLHGLHDDDRKNAIDVSYLPEEGKVFYSTKISQFFAERKNVKYWLIYQIFGEL